MERKEIWISMTCSYCITVICNDWQIEIIHSTQSHKKKTLIHKSLYIRGPLKAQPNGFELGLELRTDTTLISRALGFCLIFSINVTQEKNGLKNNYFIFYLMHSYRVYTWCSFSNSPMMRYHFKRVISFNIYLFSNYLTPGH